MIIRVDETSGAPLYEQIAAGLRRAIAQGEAGVGDRLPPAKQLAASLDVNMHTVLKAYSLLRDEGVVEMRRGRGVTVIAQGGDRAQLVEQAKSLVVEARRVGLTSAEILELLEVQL